MRTKFDIYHLVDASPDGLLASDCIMRSVVSASPLARLLRVRCLMLFDKGL
jgi:hypothetical protein